MGNETIRDGFKWDARELFLKEVILRVDIILNTNKDNIYSWYDNLCDFFDWCSCVFEEEKEKPTDKKTITETMLDELESIGDLIYAKYIYQKSIKRALSKGEIKQNHQMAYVKMRAIFRKINLKIWKLGLYVPKRNKFDPSKAASNF